MSHEHPDKPAAPENIGGDVSKVYRITAPKTWPSRRRRLAKIMVIIAIVFIALICSAAGTTYILAQDRILPNISVAGIKVGGLDRLAATELVQQRFDNMLDAGLEVDLNNHKQHLDLRTNIATDPDLVYQFIDWDINTSINEAFSRGRSGNKLLDFFAPLYHFAVARTHLQPEFILSETRIINALRAAYPNSESEGTPTDFVFVGSGDTMTVHVVEAVRGVIIDTTLALNKITDDAQDLKLETLNISLTERAAIISKQEAETLLPVAKAAVDQADYTLSFKPEYGRDLTYTISSNDLKIWLIPSKNSHNQPVLSLDTKAMEIFLNTIHADIDIAPQDAKFIIEDNRVLEFAPSRDGFIINDDQIIKDLLAALGTSNNIISIAAERTEPTVPTASANDLGITEVLGVGFSSFAGSPSNRRANIRHGADKLNGLLIPPGETLSLIEKLRPFTVADGYLPELVIKGDDIIPEVGGGLCQIGTTTFRAAMNSGLEITERRNHSLVVNYYNDPSNGNPGTDATIYDPAPDLKILNDTHHHIMLITDVDSENSELVFTFWGTSDGRQGSYTPPQVLSWTGYGTTIEKETTSLAPGVRQCQSPHPGATTTFDYNILLPDGNVKTRTFFSSYRSLPTICLVGVGNEQNP